MAETLHKGDLLLVNKFNSNYQKDDLLYFEYPAKDSTEKKTFFIQRCAAIAGDTLFLKDKLIFANGNLLDDAGGIKYNYILDTDTFNLDSLTCIKYGLYEGGSISKKGKYAYSLTKQQADALKGNKLFKSIELRLEKENIYDESVFPYSRLFNWNADNFGKLYIPKKNDSLLLDTNMIKVYGQLITKYERNKLDLKHDSIFINDAYEKKYRVKQNYYFVIGDNRDNAIDSRRWGFLPEKYIKGKVTCVLNRTEKQ